MSDKAHLFQGLDFPYMKKCCATSNGTYFRCKNDVSDTGDFLICESHAADLIRGDSIRLFKQTKIGGSALAEEFHALVERLRERVSKADTTQNPSNSDASRDGDSDGNSTSPPPANGGTQPPPDGDGISATNQDYDDKEKEDATKPSIFARFYSVESIGIAIFIVLLYFTELIEMHTLGVSASAAFSQFDKIMLALGNLVPIIVLLVGIFFLMWLVVGGVEFLLWLFWFSWVRGTWYKALFLRLFVVPPIKFWFGAARHHRKFNDWFFYGPPRPPIRFGAGSPARYRAGRGIANKALHLALRAKLYGKNRRKTAENIKAKIKTRKKETDMSGPKQIYLRHWYFDNLYRTRDHSYGLNWIQISTVVGLFIATLMFSAQKSRLHAERVAGAACQDTPLSQESPWINRLPDLVLPADCGYLVLTGRDEKQASLLKPIKSSDEAHYSAYSEQVLYVGDYGDWAAIVPFQQTEPYRELLKEKHQQEHKAKAQHGETVFKEAKEALKEIHQNLAAYELKPTLIKRSAIQEFSVHRPDNGIAKGIHKPSSTPWINVDSRGNRISYHYPDGGMSDELEQLIAKIADGVDDNGQSIAALKEEIGALRETDDLLSRQQRSIWEIAQANFALATWLSRVADRDTVLDTWKIVSDSEFGVRNTNKMLRDHVREGGKTGPAFGPLALPVPVRAADVMTTLASLNDETLEQCVRDRDNSRFVEFGRNQISPPQATAQQKDAIEEVFEATNRQVQDIMSGETRAYVFFAGAASNDGPVGWNEVLAEKRAYWAQAAWTDQFTEPGAGQNFETVAFGQGERLSKVGVGSARSVEIFVCPHQISDKEQPKDEVEQIAEK